MALEPHLIAPFDSEGAGLVEYYKPFAIGNDAFPSIEDAYIFRGNVRKREGYTLLGTIPTLPVQGLRTYLVPSTGDEQLIAFSNTKSYLFNNTSSTFNDVSFFQTSGAAISWTGGNDDFFWSTNFANAMWATNNVDPLRFFNGSPTAGWNNQKPIVSGSTRLDTCLMCIPYKGRLVILSTQEGGIAFRQRARWSQLGTPYVPAAGGDPAVVPPTPFTTDATAWRDDIPGHGGFNDADTSERIISAGIVRDTLIVFFQRSTWRLRYTGNEILPFIWERLNTQYGSEATFSTISFDDALLTFSRYGFIAADTNSVRRIDEKIPDQSFVVKSGTGLSSLQRIHGIRDFFRQNAYWAYPDLQDNASNPTNDKILSYGYLDKTFARFNQPFRCFGYYKTFIDTTWADLPIPWSKANYPWGGPNSQTDSPQVVAGDAAISGTGAGNVYIVYDQINEAQDNDENFGFNIYTKRFNPYFQQGRRCKLQYVDLYVTSNHGGEITVNHYINDDQDNICVTRTVNTSTENQSGYIRIFLGATARFHQLEITLTPTQQSDALKGTAQFQMQGLVLWTRPEGRLKG